MQCRIRLAVAVLCLVTPLAAGPSVRAADPPCLQVVAGVDLTTATIADLQSALRAGRLTSGVLVDAYLARISAYDHATAKAPNSIRHINPTARQQAALLDAERASGRVRGPLHGIPVLLKDNVGTVDEPTTAGSIALENNVPKRDATITAKLRAAGAVILGKANLAEFANWVSRTMPNGYSSLGGQVLSAYDGSNPSGSSSGSAVAMSLGLAGATIGSETAGSIVSPASYAGLVGVKPTMGLVSRAGVIPLADSWDTTGPITRSVADAAIVMNAIAGPDANDPVTTSADARAASQGDFTTALARTDLKGVRIGYDTTGPGLTSTAGGPLFARALADLTALGATIVPVQGIRLAEVTSLTELGAIFNQFKAGINHYLATEAGPGLPVKDLTDIILFNNMHQDKVKYGQDFLIASDATPGVAALGTVQAAPTIEATAATLEAVFVANQLDAIVTRGALYAYHAAASHWASLVVPNGMAGNVPDALMFVGRPFSDAKLLSYAAAFEPFGRARTPAPTAVNKGLVAAACANITARAGATAATSAPTQTPARVKGAVLARTGGSPELPAALALLALVLAMRWWGRQGSNLRRAA